MINLTNTRREIINLNTSTSYVDGAIASSINAIGEKKKLIFDYSTDIYESIEGYVLYINMAMFMPKSIINPIKGKGEIYWQCVVPTGLIGVVEVIECDLVSTSSVIQKEAFKNYSVKVNFIDYSTFQVEIEFYQTFDLLGYLSNEMALNNADRFLKDRFNSANNLTVTGNSIYSNANYDGRVYVYAENRVDSTDFGSVETLFGGYTANFYGTFPSVYGNGPEVNLSYYVGSDEVSTLNKNSDTKVLVTIDSPYYSPTLYVMVFKKNAYDNTIDFVENSKVETTKVEGGLMGGDMIINPMQTPVLTSGSIYEAYFTLSKDAIELGDQLAFVAMVYNPTLDVVSSFIFDAPPVASEVPFNGNGLTFVGTLIDYENYYAGNDLTCVIEERMGSKLMITYGSNQYKNDIANRFGISIPNNILVFLKNIKFKIYEDIVSPYGPQAITGSTQNYFIEREMVKQTGNPNIFTGMSGDFSAVVGNGYIMLLSYWRNRYESWIDCIRSVFEGVDYNTKLATQDWSNKRLKVEWSLEFYYETAAVPPSYMKTEIPSPFTDIIVFTQYITPKGYVPAVEITADTLENDAKSFRCLNETLDYKTEFTPPDAELYKVINNIELDPGNVITISEGESWAGAALGQLTTNKINPQESDLGQTVVNEQQFTINGAVLSENSYKVSSIIKRITP